MATTTIITCKCGCGRKKEVRTADLKRGWGLFYSKSCKAKHQIRIKGDTRKRGTRHKRIDQTNNREFNKMSHEDFLDMIHEKAMEAQGFDDFLNHGDL